jgi:tRNA wybutosine-synthesizing protein 1
LKKIEPPTQLYLSMDSPNKQMFDKIQKSMHKDSWKHYLESLKILKNLKKKTRTVIRLTLIHKINMHDLEGYARLIEIAKPHFIEVKSYMWLGNSKKRLTPRHSPYPEEIYDFCNQLIKLIPYKIVDKQEISRVILLQRKNEKIRRFINLQK